METFSGRFAPILRSRVMVWGPAAGKSKLVELLTHKMQLSPMRRGIPPAVYLTKTSCLFAKADPRHSPWETVGWEHERLFRASSLQASGAQSDFNHCLAQFQSQWTLFPVSRPRLTGQGHFLDFWEVGGLHTHAYVHEMLCSGASSQHLLIYDGTKAMDSVVTPESRSPRLHAYDWSDQQSRRTVCDELIEWLEAIYRSAGPNARVHLVGLISERVRAWH